WLAILSRDAPGLHARNRLKKRGASPLHNPLINSQGNPQARSARKLDSGRHHADNGMTLTVQPDHLADDIPIPSKLVAPHLVGKNRHRRGAHSLIGTRKIATEGRSDTEHAKKVVRHRRAFNLHWLRLASLEDSAVAVERCRH